MAADLQVLKAQSAGRGLKSLALGIRAPAGICALPRPPRPPPHPSSYRPVPNPNPRPSRPCSRRSRTTGTNPRKPERGRTMENDPSQCFFTGAENRIRAGTGAPFTRRKEQHQILYGYEHVTMTLLLTSGSNHTISL